MMIRRIETGDIAIYRNVDAPRPAPTTAAARGATPKNGAQHRAAKSEAAANANKNRDLVWTDQIADCVAVAVSGKTESGQRDVCLAHLHSRQYTPPARGGDLDDEDTRHPQTVRAFKKFLKEHRDDRRVLAATSWDHVVPIGGYFRMRFGLDIPRLVHLQKPCNRGVVTLDVAQFRMYGARPEAIDPKNEVKELPTVDEVLRDQATEQRHHSPLREAWRRLWGWREAA